MFCSKLYLCSLLNLLCFFQSVNFFKIIDFEHPEFYLLSLLPITITHTSKKRLFVFSLIDFSWKASLGLQWRSTGRKSFELSRSAFGLPFIIIEIFRTKVSHIDVLLLYSCHNIHLCTTTQLFCPFKFLLLTYLLPSGRKWQYSIKSYYQWASWFTAFVSCSTLLPCPNFHPICL